MPLLASRHAAFETGDQIVIADLVEGIDDFLLDGVCRFHFVLRGHAAYLGGGTSEPGFRWNAVGRGDDGGAVLAWSRSSTCCGNF